MPKTNSKNVAKRTVLQNSGGREDADRVEEEYPSPDFKEQGRCARLYQLQKNKTDAIQ